MTIINNYLSFTEKDCDRKWEKAYENNTKIDDLTLLSRI